MLGNGVVWSQRGRKPDFGALLCLKGLKIMDSISAGVQHPIVTSGLQ